MNFKKLTHIEIIPFESFKEKIEIVKECKSSARVEIVDNKYILIERIEFIEDGESSI